MGGSQPEWGRYITLRTIGCFICLSPPAWAKYRETPLWLRIERWGHGVRWFPEPRWEEIRKALQPLEHEDPPRLITDPQQGHLMVPLFLPTGVEHNAVLSALVDQVCQVADLLPAPE